MCTIRMMTSDDYPAVRALWEESEGVGLSGSDSRVGVARFLDRNPGLSFVAQDDGRLVGSVMAGHDGRRGFIYHLAVLPDHQRRGLGRELAQSCLDRLAAAGIEKCHVLVFDDNHQARAFWQAVGWTERTDLRAFSAACCAWKHAAAKCFAACSVRTTSTSASA